MAGRDLPLIPLPIGFERFHQHRFINYQLNRAHALGAADRGELHDAAASVGGADDCAPVFEALSERAAGEGRLRNAARYLRVSEFFTPHRADEKECATCASGICSAPHSQTAACGVMRWHTRALRCRRTGCRR